MMKFFFAIADGYISKIFDDTILVFISKKN
jgi:hypothetical protein